MQAERPDAPPAPIRPAATVLICRDSAAGPEVLMIQRHALSDVHGGSYVFPGGKVDPADARLDIDAHLDQPPERLHALLCEEDIDTATATAIHVAAVREIFEECGLLFARGLDAETLRQASALAADGVSFNGMLGRLGLRLDTRTLRPWSRWVTPLLSLSSPGKRFDTRFFIAKAPAGQEAQHDAHEAVHSAWLRPRAALESYWRGEIVLAAPQIMSLAHLGRFNSVDAMLADADSRPPCLVRPHTFEIEGMRATAYPGDERHPERIRVMPGPLRLVMRGKRLEPPDGFEGLWR
ncbi:NUDIX domain-containing protein [Variovorax sp. LjRoot130]|uniref:NUDIX hydrolase n=1 Tax=Variovorax sp. LjRoot130 TaxID=3342261 RepID=UPI003ECE8B28